MNQLQIVSGTGKIIYDSQQKGTYSGSNQSAVKDVEAGLLLYFDPSGQVKCFVTIYRGRPEQFFTIYESDSASGNQLQQLKEDVTRAVESDLGLRIEADAGTNQEVFNAIGTTQTTSPNISNQTIQEELTSHGTIDFQAPDGERAIQLLRYLHQNIPQQLTIAISRTQRNPRFDDADVVIILNPSSEGVRVTDESAKRIHERRIERDKKRLTDAINGLITEVGKKQTPRVLSAKLQSEFDIHVQRKGASAPGLAAFSRYGVLMFLIASLIGVIGGLIRGGDDLSNVLNRELTPAVGQLTNLLADIGAPTTAAAWQVLIGAFFLLALTVIMTQSIRRELLLLSTPVTVPLQYVLPDSSRGAQSFRGPSSSAGGEVVENIRSLYKRTNDERFLKELRSAFKPRGFKVQREEEVTQTRRLNTLLGIGTGLVAGGVVAVGLWFFSGVVFQTLAANWILFVNIILFVTIIPAVLRGMMVVASGISAMWRVLPGAPLRRTGTSSPSGPGQHERLNTKYNNLKSQGTRNPEEYTRLLWDHGYNAYNVSEGEMIQYQKAFAKLLDNRRNLISDPRSKKRIDNLLNIRRRESVNPQRERRQKRKRKRTEQPTRRSRQEQHVGGNQDESRSYQEHRGGAENLDDSFGIRINTSQSPTEASIDQDISSEPSRNDAQSDAESTTNDAAQRPPESDSDCFSMYRGDSQNSGTCPSAQAIQSEPTITWSVTVDGSISSHPVVFRNLLLVVTDTHIQAYNMATGECEQKLETPSGVRGSMAVANNTIYVSTKQGALHAGSPPINPASSRKCQLEQSHLSPPKPFGNRVYVAGIKSLYRLIDTGSKLDYKEQDLRKEIHSVPAVTDDLVLIGTADGELIAYDQDLSRECAVQVGGGIITPPAIYDKMAYVCDDDATLYRIDIERDKRGWTIDTKWKQPLSGNGVEAVGVTANKVVIGTDRGTVFAYGHEGNQVFRVDLSVSHVTTAPTLTDNNFYIGIEGGEVVAIDVNKGNERWRFHTHRELATSPIPVKDSVLVLTESGRIQALKN